MNRPRVAHLTSAHPRHDTRIFLKECRSLAGEGYDVHLYVADGKGPESREGVVFHDVGKPSGRLGRMLRKPWQIFRSVRRNGERLVHFHDPELIPVALLLKLLGVRVIYDAHEDLPRQLLSKQWIPPYARKLLSLAFESLENFAARRFDAVLAATPHIRDRFLQIGANSVAICNYPMPGELARDMEKLPGSAASGDGHTLAYVGGITAIRGVREIVQALPDVPARLILAGPFQTPGLEQELRSLPGWKQVDYRGQVDRAGVRDIMQAAQIGLVLFLPEPNHVDALPNKMFEYMSAGLPVLASDFPLWRDIIEQAGAGECTDPTRPDRIAEAIRRMLADEAKLNHYGACGRKAVETKYTWLHEKDALARVYRETLARHA